jgi:hypothetical protein
MDELINKELLEKGFTIWAQVLLFIHYYQPILELLI